MPREHCTRCGTRVAKTGDQTGFTLPHPRPAEPFGPPGLTYPKRHRALSMHFPPLRPDRQATCALPGWMHATVLYGMSTTAVPPMAARPGQAESKLSSYVAGYSYIQPNGFSFPFGVYFEMDIDSRRKTQVVWAEGLNYHTPGSIWYTSGR